MCASRLHPWNLEINQHYNFKVRFHKYLDFLFTLI